MLKEKIVQEHGLQFLKNYYNNRFFRKRIFLATEVSTKQIFGGKRADGLIVFQKGIWRKPFVVSMEAKSIKTLPAIKPQLDYRRLLRNSCRFGGEFCLVSGFIFLFFQERFGLSWIDLFLFLIVVASVYAFTTLKSHRHQTVDVIDQLKQYPANEQWLAFSGDAFSSLAPAIQKMLRAICSRKGIGILIIKRKNQVRMLVKPKRNRSGFLEKRGGWHWISDFLFYYRREAEIREYIL